MPLFDLPLDQLREYKPDRHEPEDFDDFWQGTLAEARQHPLEASFEPADYGLATIESHDLTFNGYAGQPVKGWFMVPKNAQKEPLPCVVEYIGYGGGRSHPPEWLLWSAAGYAHLVMDTRGQGGNGLPGHTQDREPGGSDPQHPGFLTCGVLDPETYYYRRVFSDAARAVEAAREHPAVDPERVAVYGKSQGGGIALAAAGLVPDVSALLTDVPFLCHYRRASEVSDEGPYPEIAGYLRTHRDRVEEVFGTLSYFDGVNFAARAGSPALFSVGMMDVVCPPSTVFAAYNHYAGEKDIKVWPYDAHQTGIHQTLEKMSFLRGLWGTP